MSPWVGSKWACLDVLKRATYWITLLEPIDDRHWRAVVQAVGSEELRLEEKTMFPIPNVTYMRID